MWTPQLHRKPLQSKHILTQCALLQLRLPSQHIKISAGIMIAMQVRLWSIVSMSQSAITFRARFLATRGLLGSASISRSDQDMVQKAGLEEKIVVD